MKRIAEFIFLVTAFLCVSCSKDSENQTDETGSVYGIVIDADSGLAVPNVSIELYEGMPGAYGEMVGASITGNDGSFSFVGIMPYDVGHMLVTSHPDYIDSRKHISVKAGQEIQVSISISPK